MSEYRTLRGKNWTVWYDGTLLNTVSPQHFEPGYWQNQGAVTGAAGGRRLAYFIEPGDLVKEQPFKLVLRHYYRGGLIGRLNEDAFFGVSVRKSRAMREFSLLRWMWTADLPVPRPVAALFQRSGLLYRSDILIELLRCDGDLFSLLKISPLEDHVWKQLGAMIRTFHAKGIYHSDLNCHNILIKQEEARTRLWLIDFDKCEKRQPGAWQQHNLQRLQRSLLKEAKAHPAFAFNYNHWTALMDGYHET